MVMEAAWLKPPFSGELSMLRPKVHALSSEAQRRETSAFRMFDVLLDANAAVQLEYFEQ